VYSRVYAIVPAPTTYDFVLRHRDLHKRCRSGKLIEYRFFLFSDQLLYAHMNIRGEYKVHEQLLLSVMKVSISWVRTLTMTRSSWIYMGGLQVVEIPQDPTGRSFRLYHPKKSFDVVAESREVFFRTFVFDTTLNMQRLARHSKSGRERFKMQSTIL
jgi:hypothetical protein